jgi:hypothetical protein
MCEEGLQNSIVLRMDSASFAKYLLKPFRDGSSAVVACAMPISHRQKLDRLDVRVQVQRNSEFLFTRT